MKINLLYFSCGRDKKLLELSIESMRRNFNHNRIIVAVDPRDPVSSSDGSFEGVEFYTRETASEKLYGLENIWDMHSFFDEFSQDCDYVQKCDSDILCCSDFPFRKLEAERPDAYGGFPMANPKMIPKGHFNGNTYFLKSAICRKLKNQRNIPEIQDWKWMNYPEDMVTSSMVKSITQNVLVDWTESSGKGNFLFDIYLTKVLTLPAEEIREFGFGHFRTSYLPMEYAFNKIYENSKN